MSLSLGFMFPSPCISSSRSLATYNRKGSVRCTAEPARQIEWRPTSNAYSGFPPGFFFGAASAAFQVEGGTKEGGRGQSIWDKFCEDYPEKIIDRSNGEPGAGSYRLYQKDVQLLKELGANVYRFSISWSRILPTGHGEPNKEGVQYYNNLIDELIKNNIVPFITLFHWDVPQKLEKEYGGFLSNRIVDDFKHFADVCFNAFGKKVSHWITFNEPTTFINGGYSLGMLAPGHCTPGLTLGTIQLNCPEGDSLREPYIVGHNLLKAHAEAVKLYREKYNPTKLGKIGITLTTSWYVPYSNNPLNVEAQKRALEFNIGWFMDPLKFGDYPFSMKSLVRERLPQFTKEESDKLRGSYDFLGLNYYTASYAKHKVFQPDFQPTISSEDVRVDTPSDKNGVPIGYAEEGSWVYVYPTGLKELLLYVKGRYNNPDIFITENGAMTVVKDSKIETAQKDNKPIEELKDAFRAQYQAIHLHELVEAMRLGVNMKGYFVWSLLDSFEWNSGYTSKFGLTYTNNGPFKPYEELVREPKDSYYWYKWFISVAKNPKLLVGTPIPTTKVTAEDGYDEEEEEEVTVDVPQTVSRVTAVY